MLEQQKHTLRKDLKRKAKIVIWDMKRLVPQPRKGGVKELDQEARLKRDNSVERQYTRKTGRSASGKEDPLPRFNCKKMVMIEGCGYWHPPHCKYFKKDKCEMGKDCPFVHTAKEEAIFHSSTKGNRESRMFR